MGFKKKTSKTISSTKKSPNKNKKYETMKNKIEDWPPYVYTKKDPKKLEKEKLLRGDPEQVIDMKELKKLVEEGISEVVKNQILSYMRVWKRWALKSEWIVIYDNSETIAGFLIFWDFKNGKEKEFISTVGSKGKYIQKKKELVERQTKEGHTTVDYEKNWLVLHRIFVKDEYRGRKYGNALLNHFRNIISERASSVVVNAPSKDFINFSAKCDFKISSDWISLPGDWLEN